MVINYIFQGSNGRIQQGTAEANGEGVGAAVRRIRAGEEHTEK